MPDQMQSAMLRRWAMECAAQADSVDAGPKRERLMTMRTALLALADTQDWLDGHRPDLRERPPMEGQPLTRE